MGILIFVAIALFLAGPILAIMALAAVRRMEGETLHLQVPQLTSRIYLLEKRISALEQAVRQGSSAAAKPETVKPATRRPTAKLVDKVRAAEPTSGPAEPEGA